MSDNSYEWTAENGHRIYVTNWKKCIKVQYEAIQRVRELHSKSDSGYCEFCSDEVFDGTDYGFMKVRYPCPTIKALFTTLAQLLKP